jgi:ABC-type multidrug transport system ATPase subunit
MGKMANKVLVLDEGKNKYLGAPEELIRRFPKRILLKTKSASLPEDIQKHIVQVDEDENGNFSYLFSAGEQTDDVFIRIKNSAIEITHLSIIETNLKEAFMQTIKM